MSDTPSLLSLIPRIESDFNNTIDVLIANAGRGVQVPKIEDLSIEEFEKTHATNLRAPFILAKLTIPGMKKKKWGRLILIGSVAGFTGGVVGAHYASSKSGLHGLVHWISANCARDGITANTVAPAVGLKWHTGLLLRNSPSDYSNPQLIEDTFMLPGDPGALAQRIPVGRLGKPDEVAKMVELMVTTGYMTNQTVLIDGGLYPT
jgi:3-oxoacyl-[acyl-carrier protein] reductase